MVCHPHPSYGGDRLHPVVDAVFRRASDHGGTALRFDFRRSFDDGRGERLDVIAAAERLRATETETETETTPAPLVLVGYSFGALMALAATCGRDAPDPPPAALVLIAPPLGTAATSEPPCHDGPTLLVVAEQDQFAPPAVVEPIVADWPRTAIETIAGADHFLVGRADEVAERVGEWSERYLGR